MIKKILVFAVFVCAASVLAKSDAYVLKQARRDSRFVDFEKYFDVTNVRTQPVYNQGSDSPCCVIAEDCSIYATPKVDRLFENLSFRFDWRFQWKRIGCFIETNTQSFNESPIDDVKLYEKIKKSIYKNPSFAKWLLQEGLRYKEERLRYEELFGESYVVQFGKSHVARIRYEKSINDGFWGSPVDYVWENVGMSGKYVGTLRIGYESEYRGRLIKCGGVVGYDFSTQYEFMLSDSGDILVSLINYPGSEKLLGVTLDKEYLDIDIRRCKKPMLKKIPSYAKRMYCNYSVVFCDYCEKNLSAYKSADKGFYLVAPKFCDYLIIRKNGKIEYGFNSKTP